MLYPLLIIPVSAHSFRIALLLVDGRAIEVPALLPLLPPLPLRYRALHLLLAANQFCRCYTCFRVDYLSAES